MVLDARDGPDVAEVHSSLLLRGACHRARIRATRWLAMTVGGNRYGTRPLVQGGRRYTISE
jgi:hypothetical protein